MNELPNSTGTDEKGGVINEFPSFHLMARGENGESDQ